MYLYVFILQEQRYYAAGIHVGTKDLQKNDLTRKSTDPICNDMINIALRCRCHNIATILVSIITYSTQISFQLIQNLKKLLYNACVKYGFEFVDNNAVSKSDLWRVGVHLLESGKAVIANSLLIV